MVKRKPYFLLILLAWVFALCASLIATPVSAQTYRFTLPIYEVEAYLEKDGSLTLHYIMTFENDASASPIDFVDVAMPNASYSFSNATASIDGAKINHIKSSSYVSGAELGLGNMAIQPGASGTVMMTITDVKPVLYPYDGGDKQGYVNFQMTPNYFGAQYDRSTNTKYRMTIVLPPGVAADQGLYFEPKRWPGSTTPQEASLTKDGRVYYSWYTENADAHTEYLFGTAFPASVVPAESVSSKETYANTDYGPATTSDGGKDFWRTLPCCGGIILILAGFIYLSIKGNQAANKRKLSYLPPKISMEGQGIKRGLTAVEAAILMEEPMSKILTMILFGLVKKGAVSVTQKEPLQVQAASPLPAGLYPYETGFIEAALNKEDAKRRSVMQSTMIDLVKDVTDKMKGFSQKETVEYYTDIMNRAWKSVQDSETPEVKSDQFEKVLEWTMLDGQFDDRTRKTFDDTVIVMPRWWGNYDPTYRDYSRSSGGGALGKPASVPSGSGSSSSAPTINMPRLPGSDFAASLLGGMQTTAAGIVGDITGFQGSVTSKTNPVPVSRSISGGGGWRGGGGGGGHSSCACACACAGCACACAGGGR
ncbi:MAG: DUF2207 domain-containing protein [Anaerolineaceae bacterium]|nr:DUF2207 domain-containing protein [Anaerolineaceae bacterium]